MPNLSPAIQQLRRRNSAPLLLFSRSNWPFLAANVAFCGKHELSTRLGSRCPKSAPRSSKSAAQAEPGAVRSGARDHRAARPCVAGDQVPPAPRQQWGPPWYGRSMTWSFISTRPALRIRVARSLLSVCCSYRLPVPVLSENVISCLVIAFAEPFKHDPAREIGIETMRVEVLPVSSPGSLRAQLQLYCSSSPRLSGFRNR